jgi:hypothetical protein
MARISGSTGSMARPMPQLLVIPLDGSARIGDAAVVAGECAMAGQIGDVSFSGRCLIAQPCG